ncbi:MAG: Rrf2 family transcriptional regulator [Alphaproteobacteria bacterium]|nr:Rrf2 family transcriptional regulator [Alphaproteobacteria bacterium]
MKLTPQEEYGLRCLLQVARQAPCPAVPPVSIERIAELEGIGYEHAAKMMRLLRRGGVVVSTRGAKGGFHLARPADRISVWDALVALDPPLYGEGFCDAFTGQQESCAHANTACELRAVWRFVGSALEAGLSKLTLADLMRGGIPSGTSELQGAVS